MKKASIKHIKPARKKIPATPKEVKSASELVMKKYSRAIKKLAAR